MNCHRCCHFTYTNNWFGRCTHPMHQGREFHGGSKSAIKEIYRIASNVEKKISDDPDNNNYDPSKIPPMPGDNIDTSILWIKDAEDIVREAVLDGIIKDEGKGIRDAIVKFFTAKIDGSRKSADRSVCKDFCNKRSCSDCEYWSKGKYGVDDSSKTRTVGHCTGNHVKTDLVPCNFWVDRKSVAKEAK